MSDLLVIIRMILDLLTGGDPTLPTGHTELIPLAIALATIRDILLTLTGH